MGKVESVWFDDGKDLSNPTLSGKVEESPVQVVEEVTPVLVPEVKKVTSNG
jgi:hypothetical protein